MVTPPHSFADLAALLRDVPDHNAAAAQAARDHDQQLTKPPGSLGQLETMASWLSGWQRCHPPKAEAINIYIFAASHGVTKHPVSAFPSAVTAQMVANFANGGAAINQLAELNGASLKVIDVGVASPTKDFLTDAAMTPGDFFKAFESGWLCVDPQADIIAIGEMGIGNTTSASAICLALLGGTSDEWVGPGTGVSGSHLSQKTEIVGAAVGRHKGDTSDPLELFCRLGGRELAAMAGATLRARYEAIPVVVDGFIASSSLLPLFTINPRALDHCWPGHVSAEPAHSRLLKEYAWPKPALNLDLRLGEGSGAALALSIFRAAVACHNGMATFASAGVSGGS